MRTPTDTEPLWPHYSYRDTTDLAEDRLTPLGYLQMMTTEFLADDEELTKIVLQTSQTHF